MEDVIPQSAVAELLDCTVSTVQERALSGDLPGVQFGRSWVFPRAALVARLNEIALEQAAKRRKDPAAPAAGLPVAKSRRRAPVALPEMPS